MTTTCQKLPQSVAEEMLQVVARAICDRPADNPAQRESRTRQMVHSTMGFDPRDGLEYMLTTMAVGHFNLILDSMFDVFQGQLDTMKARTKSTIVALDRSMLAFVREMQVNRRRPVARWAEDSAVMKAPAEAEVAPVAAAATEPERPDTPDAAPEPAVATKARTQPRPVAPALARIVPPRGHERTPETAKAGSPPVASNPREQAEVVMSEDDESRLEKHVAEFQDALAAMAETLAEARALDGGPGEADAASGD